MAPKHLIPKNAFAKNPFCDLMNGPMWAHGPRRDLQDPLRHAIASQCERRDTGHEIRKLGFEAPEFLVTWELGDVLMDF